MRIFMRGKVDRVYETPAGVDRDGKPYKGSWNVQLIGETKLKNGQVRTDLQTIKTDDPKLFEVGQEIMIEVSAYVSGDRQIRYSAVSGAEPTYV